MTATCEVERLAAAYPAFQITRYRWHDGRQPRWIAQRINATDEGLHTIITADLTELHAALARDAMARPGQARYFQPAGKSAPDDHA